TLRTTCLRVRPFAFLHHPSVEPFLDQPQDAGVSDAMLHEPDQPTLVEVIEKSSNVGSQNVVHLLLQERVRQRIQCLMLAAPRTKPIRVPEKVFLVNLVEDGNHGLLDKFVFDSRDREWTWPPIFFLYIHPSRWHRSIG